jgi:hypothetical protein
MAAGYLPEPGSEWGPCVDPCSHSDCALTRADAQRSCRICAESIGYDRGYYREGNRDTGWILVHAVCALEEVEKARS